ncbi:MAG: hypothetical protein US30_C0003G0014 [Candidatus Moranbacteria bacterium GW2011_GWF2_36_839]|nr:MAG: hypothetical protein US27_C0004G0014 [Candidatus Moranbacteria bacterium GW2011_GWF1_36_78]KKQ17447.1 MAG: hypothetical protein US30_C0003G0014 [Candidatus Moranbacteria bacterium GW2011_GWF2_36_839]HAT73914.1 hypothetical protein [Candidatus Moranbacteria bacterium]HBY10560.1 hypothetical protein [Candidatus Moranbacteria bacterium]
MKSLSNRKGLPVDFSTMSISDLTLIIQIIEALILKAEKKDGKLVGSDEDIARITVPLRRLAEVFHIDYFINIRMEVINKTVNEIKRSLGALSALEADFFLLIKEKNKDSQKEKKNLPGLRVATSSGVYKTA